ncbi:MAG TPA: hypothetical protein VFZ91_07635 [Allosphingosinicella sp.]
MHNVLGSFVERNSDDGDGTLTADVTPENGKLKFTVGADGDDAAQIRTTQFNGVKISDLTKLQYTTNVSQWVDGQAIYIIMQVDLDGVPGGATTLLFFEPVYQSATFFPSNPQGTVALNTDQTWDALNGGWWSTTGLGGAGPGTDVKSLDEILAAYPNATVGFSELGAIRFVAGFGAGAWDNFVGTLDDVVIGVGGIDTTFAFTDTVHTIDGTNQSDVIHGDQDGPSADHIFGNNGSDQLFGEAGSDTLEGGNGNDSLDGGSGNDVLAGGNGQDVLTGGSGADIFVFGRGGGSDVVVDFDSAGGDRIRLEDGLAIKSVKVFDANGDGILDTQLMLSNGSVTFYGTGSTLDTVAEWNALVVI